jgi:lincosamide nucleotidyltransferase A/C/D/E
MFFGEDVISLYQRLSAINIQIWLTGGWGIDALLEEETRPHKDLDFIMLVDDVVRLRDHLTSDGYELKELWSENRWVVDSDGVEIPTAFVMHDVEGREIDVHAMRIDDQGNGIPAWSYEKLIFKQEDLAGEGLINGFPIPCISIKMQQLCHRGYELPSYQQRDLDLLQEKFGVENSDGN